MEPAMIGLICIIIMLYLLLTGMNIGLLFIAVGIIGFTWLYDFDAAIGLLRSSIYTTAASYNYSVVPLFILMGQFAYHSGITTNLFDVAGKWLGRCPGGLASATVAACAAFGAVCGSIAATTATMGQVAVPEMRRHGYSNSLSTGCVAAGGGIGILIPPSTPLIIYGICTQLSIGELFAAGVGPGLLTTVVFIAVITVMVLLKPEIAPKSEKYSLKEKLKSLRGLIGIVVLFGAVFVGMFAGLFTVNEAAAVGTFMTIIIMVINRRFTWKLFLQAMKESLISYSMVYVILLGAQVLSAFLAATKLPSVLASLVASANLPMVLVLAIIIVIYLLMGCFIDGVSMVLLTVPIFYPIILQSGVNPLWFGVLCVVCANVGSMTPPVGMCVYIVAGQFKDIPMADIFRGIWPYLFGYVIVIVLMIAFPSIATFLPGIMYS